MTFLSLWNWLKPRHRQPKVCRLPRRHEHTVPARVVPRLEALEDRTVPSTLTVTSAADDGSAVTLRAVIAAASSADTINFAPSLAGQTITLTKGELAITQSLDIEGLGANQLSISGNNQSRVFDITASTASVTIAGLTIRDGLDFYGGGITNVGTLTVNYCTLSGNGAYSPDPEASDGGAIDNSGTLTINNSTISGNTAIGAPGNEYGGSSGTGPYGGASPGGNGRGGGIYASGGTLSINSSTIADNEAVGGDSAAVMAAGYVGFPGNGYGGGLYIAGGTVSINNSTLAGNDAEGGASEFYVPTGDGGGICNFASPSALRVYDTIVAGNTANSDPDLDGGVTSQGHNLVGNTTGGNGFVASDLLNVNPQLGALQNNGSPTQTMALLPGSRAIDAGDNTNAPAYDQRGPGFPRIVNGAIDIGAFEVQNGSPTQTGSLAVSGFPSSIQAGTSGSFTVTAVNPDGSIDTSYTDTVYFTSSDTRAALPANYTFTAADAGSHTFSATLKTAGRQSITTTDTANASITGTEGGITVQPAAASKFVLTAPSSVRARVSFSLTLTVEDAYGNLVTGYTGTVHFSSTDGTALLPANYTFTAGDAGVHTFTGLVLHKKGKQKITITDTLNSALTGSVIVDVL
jgi:hypothetical protein